MQQRPSRPAPSQQHHLDPACGVPARSDHIFFLDASVRALVYTPVCFHFFFFISISMLHGWRVEGPYLIQNAETDGTCFLYASLSFCVHEDFGLSCFPLLIANAYSSVYYDASRSRKGRGFFLEIDSYSPVESEFRDDPYILCFQLFRVSCSFRFSMWFMVMCVFHQIAYGCWSLQVRIILI